MQKQYSYSQLQDKQIATSCKIRLQSLTRELSTNSSICMTRHRRGFCEICTKFIFRYCGPGYYTAVHCGPDYCIVVLAGVQVVNITPSKDRLAAVFIWLSTGSLFSRGVSLQRTTNSGMLVQLLDHHDYVHVVWNRVYSCSRGDLVSSETASTSPLYSSLSTPCALLTILITMITCYILYRSS